MGTTRSLAILSIALCVLSTTYFNFIVSSSTSTVGEELDLAKSLFQSEITIANALKSQSLLPSSSDDITAEAALIAAEYKKEVADIRRRGGTDDGISTGMSEAEGRALVKMIAKMKKHNDADGKVFKKLEDYDDTDFSHLLPLAVIGFPKTGSSTMLRWLPKHKDIIMTQGEDCSSIYNSIPALVGSGWTATKTSLNGRDTNSNVGPTVSRNYWIDWINTHVNDEGDKQLLLSLKCPASAEDARCLWNLATFFPRTPVVIGLRHPVLWFESFWNYRVKNMNKKYLDDGILPYPHMAEKRNWGGGQDPYMSRGEFHAMLALMGRTEMSDPDELELLGPLFEERQAAVFKQYGFEKVPNPVFLFETNQLKENSLTFNRDILTFAKVDAEFSMPSMYKVTPGEANEQFRTVQGNAQKNNPEQVKCNMIDICDPVFELAHEHLMSIARNASEWITEYFIKAEGIVSSGDFVGHVLGWKKDPCEERRKITIPAA